MSMTAEGGINLEEKGMNIEVLVSLEEEMKGTILEGKNGMKG